MFTGMWDPYFVEYTYNPASPLDTQVGSVGLHTSSPRNAKGGKQS